MFNAVNGSIDVQIPGEAHTNVWANAVCGFISNDFGLQVHRTIVARWLNGEINGGAARCY